MHWTRLSIVAHPNLVDKQSPASDGGLRMTSRARHAVHNGPYLWQRFDFFEVYLPCRKDAQICLILRDTRQWRSEAIQIDRHADLRACCRVGSPIGRSRVRN